MTEDFLIEYSMDLGGAHADILQSAILTENQTLLLAGSSNSASIKIGEGSFSNEGGGKDTPSVVMLLRLGEL